MIANGTPTLNTSHAAGAKRRRQRLETRYCD
jgi:hypothetical protein